VLTVLGTLGIIFRISATAGHRSVVTIPVVMAVTVLIARPLEGQVHRAVEQTGPAHVDDRGELPPVTALVLAIRATTVDDHRIGHQNEGLLRARSPLRSCPRPQNLPIVVFVEP